jgi:hypothetical protein
MNYEKKPTDIDYNYHHSYEYWLNNLQSQVTTDLDVSLESDFNGNNINF